MNLWKWEDFIEEKDIRVHIQILLDWIDGYLQESVLPSVSALEYLEKCKENQEFKFDFTYRENLSKVNFKVIEKITASLLLPLYGKKDFNQVLNRVVISVLGSKQKFKENFEGRKLKKLSFETSSPESRLCDVLKSWCEKMMIH